MSRTNGHTAEEDAGLAGTAAAGSRDRLWHLRAWHGMTLEASWRLLAANHFAVSPRRLSLALMVLALGPFNSLWARIQRSRYGRQIARTEIRPGPVIIVGHWRSGTTLLHELLALDPEHTWPSTYECFAAGHFLVSGSFLPPLVRRLLPSRRPMDNMAFGLERPQEDEFALCSLGVRSPYWTIAFPNRPPQNTAYLTLEPLKAKDLHRWQQAFLGFLKSLTFRRPKRLVLKSPPHTARIRTLLGLLPEPRFVHIVRDPYELFPSTVKLWKRLFRRDGFQVPRYEGLADHVFDTLVRIYEAFERDRGLIPSGRLCEVRFEQLVADPVGQMERVYRQLDLGPFDRVRPALERYAASQAGYRRSRYQLNGQIRRQITQRWAAYIDRYQYNTGSRH